MRANVETVLIQIQVVLKSGYMLHLKNVGKGTSLKNGSLVLERIDILIKHE